MDNKGRKVYAVDFDKTLSMARYPDVGEPNTLLFKMLIEEQKKGAIIILNSCRTGEALVKAVQFCNDNGLIFDAINDNADSIIEKFGDNPRKISADVYIDDKALKPITEITHTLKLQEGFADAVLNKRKTFEIRRNDRGFQKGDTVAFKVIDKLGTHKPHALEEKVFVITYVMSDYGLQDGYVVFGLKEV